MSVIGELKSRDEELDRHIQDISKHPYQSFQQPKSTKTSPPSPHKRKKPILTHPPKPPPHPSHIPNHNHPTPDPRKRIPNPLRNPPRPPSKPPPIKRLGPLRRNNSSRHALPHSPINTPLHEQTAVPPSLVRRVHGQCFQIVAWWWW